MFQNYVDVFKKSRDLGSAFITRLGLKPGKIEPILRLFLSFSLTHSLGNDTHVGIYGKNCPEWFISSIASVRFSMVTVPLYDTLGADAAKFIVQQTEIA